LYLVGDIRQRRAHCFFGNGMASATIVLLEQRCAIACGESGKRKRTRLQSMRDNEFHNGFLRLKIDGGDVFSLIFDALLNPAG